MSRRAFTVRELLWAVALITALPAALFPVLDRAYANHREQLNAELRKAAEDEDRAEVERLLNAGADIDSVDQSGRVFPRTALNQAACTGRLEILRVLVEHGGDVNAAVPDSTAPLAHIVHRRDPEIVRLMLERGADPDAPDASGEPALMRAVMPGNAEVVRLLLEYGADPDALDDKGDRPLHWAARNEMRGCVEVLLEYGADPNGRSDPHRLVPHEYAGGPPIGRVPLRECLGSPEIVQLLLDHGADPNARAAQGGTLLDYARGLAEEYPDVRRSVELLRAHGAR